MTSVSTVSAALSGQTTATTQTQATAQTPATTKVGAQVTSTQMNQFLQLLTTELQHQDPTQPSDPTQFVAQLAQFSSVEQLTQSNATLTSISSALGGLSLGQYSGLINRSVTAPAGTVTVPGSGSVSAKLTFNITDKSLNNPHVAVTNASGSVVASLPVNGVSGTVTFDGTDGKGNNLPAGDYTVALVGTAAGATGGTSASAGTLTTTNVVTGVSQASGGSWNLQLQDGETVSASTITSVVQPVAD